MIFLRQILAIGSSIMPLYAHGLEVPEHYHPVRPNGMGGAYTAVANDENAVWTNPAGISRIRKARSRKTSNLVKFPNAIAGGNKSLYTTYKADSAEGASAISGASAEDNPFWVVAGAFPMFMFNVGRQVAAVTGAYSHTTMEAVVDSENTEQANTEIISDAGGVLGMALTNKSNRFSLGVQARSIGRYAYEGTLPVTTLTDQDLLESEFKEGSNQSAAVGVDIGAIWTLADFWFPTIGISVLNVPTGCKKDYLNPFSKTRETVCGTVFSGNFANPDAVSTVDPTDIRFGISMTPRLSRKIALRIAAGVHHYHVTSGENNYGLSSIPILKTIHGGVELFVGNPLTPSPFSITTGYSQGFATWGVSTRLSFLSLDFASFGRDISTTSTPKEDRRYLGGVSFDF